MAEGSGVPGRVSDVRLADATFEGTLTKAAGEGSTVVMPIEQGMTMLVAWFHGVYGTATTVMEVSPDNENWYALGGANINNGSATQNPLSKSTNANLAWEAAIPAGSKFVRARCSEYTSGTVNVEMAQGSSDYETSIAAVVSGSLGIASQGVWNDLSSTTLAGNATFTGAAQEVENQVSGTGFSTFGTAGQGEIRISATTDKPGTLYLETSRDNATWTRVKGIAVAKFDATCENYGEIVHKPSERYFRAAYVNGAEAQTKFKCQAMRVAVL